MPAWSEYFSIITDMGVGEHQGTNACKYNWNIIIINKCNILIAFSIKALKKVLR